MNKITKLTAGAICSIAVIIGIVQQRHPDLRTSPQGMAIIGNAEGCRRDPYQCPADVLTVGVGSTEASGMPIDPTKRYSDQEIADRWANDIRIAENCVNRYGNGKAMPQGAFDPMVSLTFNMGCGAMKKSTLFRLAQKGYSKTMCDQFDRWNKAGNRVLKGLVIRRSKEKALCLAN